MPTEGDGPYELMWGAIAGLIGFGALGIVKVIGDVIAYLSWDDIRPLRVLKGALDLAVGLGTAYDAYMHPKDDFWKGGEWTFAALETITGGIQLTSAIIDYITGSLGRDSIDVKIEKKVLEALTGRRYE